MVESSLLANDSLIGFLVAEDFYRCKIFGSRKIRNTPFKPILQIYDTKIRDNMIEEVKRLQN